MFQLIFFDDFMGFSGNARRIRIAREYVMGGVFFNFSPYGRNLSTAVVRCNSD